MARKPNYLVFENRLQLYDSIISKTPSLQPLPGTFYKVPEGAFIDTISLRAYGRNRNEDIVKSNTQLLKNRQIEPISGLPQIWPNDFLWLPVDDLQPEDDEVISADSEDEIAIRINGVIFKGWTANNIERSINTIADSFSFQAPFSPDDPESVYLDPYTYLETDLFIGGKLYIAGRSESWTPSIQAGSTITTIQSRSRSGIIVDCPSTEKKLNFSNQNLQQIANTLLLPFGIKTFFPFGVGDIFKKTKRNLMDKLFSYLQGLAKKAGFIINSTRTGEITFDRANLDGLPVMSIVEGSQPLISLTASYNGTDRYSEYTAISQSRGKPGNNFTVFDKSITIFRPFIFSAKDTRQGNIQTSAEWERSKALAKSVKITAVIGTWRDQNNNLFLENEIVTLIAPKIHFYNETKMLIEKVNLSETKTGKQATLSLVLPQSYSLEFPERFPWQR